MSNTIPFTKLHGLGNDFILMHEDDIPNAKSVDFPALALKTCNRHTGIGADGLIVAFNSKKADTQMRVWNADSSEAEMCGNGIRCFAKFLQDRGEFTGDSLKVDTGAGVLEIVVAKADATAPLYRVDMGQPILKRKDIPVAGPENTAVVKESILVNNQLFSFSAVSMGNPHAVVFVDSLANTDTASLGPAFEKHELFPNGVNVEFVETKSPIEHEVIVWERGAGFTMACGTGACAVLVSAVLNDRSATKATVQLPGGPLDIEWDLDSKHVFMTGPAETVYQGQIEI